MSYIINHWRGNVSLKVAFWVNFFALLLVLAIFEPLWISAFTSDPEKRVEVAFISLLITRLLIFPWQLIGLIRASDQHFLLHGNTYLIRTIHGGIVLAVFYTLVHIIGTLQTVFIFKHEADLYAAKSGRTGYQITTTGDQLSINGVLDIGITREVRKMIENNPRIKSVLLESPGGQIYQGRGLAKLISDYELDTYVLAECSSACVTAFIAGNKRYLGQDGKLGFHQYKFDTSHTYHLMPLYRGLADEQQQDLEMYESKGIKQEFLDKIYHQSADNIWFPGRETLLESRVVHGVR